MIQTPLCRVRSKLPGLRWAPGLGLFLILVSASAFPQQQPEGSGLPAPSAETQAAGDPEATADERRVIPNPVGRCPALLVVDVLKSPFSLLGKGLDKGAAKLEKGHALERAQDLQIRLQSKGIEPLFGGLGPGAALTLGVNISREHFRGTNARLEIPIRVSTNRYLQAGVLLEYPFVRADKLFLQTGFQYDYRPQEDFFGLGADSSELDRSNYKLDRRSAGILLGSRLRKNLLIGIPLRFQSTNVGRGTDPRLPDLQDRFAVDTLPGAVAGSELLSFGALLEWDYRNNPGIPTKGGVWRVEALSFQDTNSDDFRFMRYRVETAHYLPLGDEHGFVVRALAEINEEKGHSAVPFFEKPILGGKETMRGFREFRYRDDNALLFNVEYRWRIWQFADAVLFVDEGQVAADPGDFGISRFRNSHGLGFRFRSKQRQIFRVDVGHSGEGWRYYFTFSPKF